MTEFHNLHFRPPKGNSEYGTITTFVNSLKEDEEKSYVLQFDLKLVEQTNVVGHQEDWLFETYFTLTELDFVNVDGGGARVLGDSNDVYVVASGVSNNGFQVVDGTGNYLSYENDDTADKCYYDPLSFVVV
jgi:hypothetical protein